ncbi:MAG: hypothetical protein ACKOD0_00965, partial [Actinomycetota bacterium]
MHALAGEPGRLVEAVRGRPRPLQPPRHAEHGAARGRRPRLEAQEHRAAARELPDGEAQPAAAAPGLAD